MKIKFVLGLFLLSAVSSCLSIFQPLAVKENIITDDRLAGQWRDQDGKKIIVQKFMDSELKSYFQNSKESKEDSIYITKMYVIQIFDNNYYYTWVAGLVNINHQKFINLLPLICVDKDSLSAEPEGKESSTIARLDYNNSTITLQFLNGDYIKQILLSGKAHLKYEYDPLFGNMAVTASSEELEKFLEKYGDNQQLYNGGERLTLRK